VSEERPSPAEPDGPASPRREGQPPRLVLYLLYASFFLALVAVLVIVGVYGI